MTTAAGAKSAASLASTGLSKRTRKARTGWAMFLTVCSPISSNTTTPLLRRWSRTLRETQMPPGSAMDSRRGDVYAVTVDVAVLDHDIADIDADAKPHTALFAEGQVGLGKITLDLNGALYGGKYAGEFGENAVTGRAADPAAVLRDDRVGDGSMGRERRQRVFLGDAHQAAIPLDIGGEDGDELPLERRRFHVS